MPQTFTCPNCRHAHRFLAALAGQSMHCHQCGFFFRIPLVPLASPEGVDFSNARRWLLRLASGRQFGPVLPSIIQEWLREGRANADCIVAPEHSHKWYRLTDIFSPAGDAHLTDSSLSAPHKTDMVSSAGHPAEGPSASSSAASILHATATTASATASASASASTAAQANANANASNPSAATPPNQPASTPPKGHKRPTRSRKTLPSGTSPHSTAPDASPAAIIPASGLLTLWDDCSQSTPRGHFRAIFRDHAEALKSLEAESARAGGLLRMRGSALVHLESEPAPRHPRHGPDPLRIEAVTVTAWSGPLGSEFYCLIPWSPLGRLPHEFLSILPGRLPAPVALRRATEDAFAGGSWIGITGDNTDVMAHAAEVSREALHQDIEWQWRSDDRRYQMILVWGVQAIPLGPEKFAHLIQTAVRPDPLAPAGLRWYLDRQSSFWRFARRLNLPGAPGSPVLFSSCGARLLTLAAERLGQSPVA